MLGNAVTWTAVTTTIVVLGAVASVGVARPPLRGEETTVSGTVKRFTSAPKGEVDGMVLSDGTVVHWQPHLERRFKGSLRTGDRVRVVGRLETNPEGETQLEASRVTSLQAEDAPDGEEIPRPSVEGGNRPARKADDTEKRLRKPEDKLERLTEEIRQMKR